MTIVWKWNIRWRPIKECSKPDRSNSRGVSMAPAASTTKRAVSEWVVPSASMYSTPVATPFVTISFDTNVSGRSWARPVSRARCSGATGSPLAWMGHP